MNLNYVLIGKRIKEKRMENQISQMEMADYLHFSYQHISNIERGNSGISLELLIRISELLHVSIDYLLQDNMKQPNLYADSFLIANMEDYLMHQQKEINEFKNILQKINPIEQQNL